MASNKFPLSMDETLEKIGLKKEERKAGHTVLPIPKVCLDPDFDPSEGDISFLRKNIEKYSTLLEFYYLKNYTPTSVYCIPSNFNLLEWHGIIYVHQGLYKGGSFRFVIFIPDNYPDGTPTVNFLDEVFHPLVDPEQRRLEYRGFMKRLDKRTKLAIIIGYIKEIFYQEDLIFAKIDQVQNHEAYDLLINNKKEFISHIQESIRSQNQNRLNDNQDFSFKFQDEGSETIESMMKSIKTIVETKPISEREESLLNWLFDILRL